MPQNHQAVRDTTSVYLSSINIESIGGPSFTNLTEIMEKPWLCIYNIHFGFTSYDRTSTFGFTSYNSRRITSFRNPEWSRGL